MTPSAKAPIVLAVDDSALMLRLIDQVLGQEYQMILVDNAVEALAVIYREPIAALILDITMPEVDGLELCRTLRSLPQFRTLPIIMLTARDTPFDKVQGRMAGATEYLIKPVTAEQLRQTIEQFVPVVFEP